MNELLLVGFVAFAFLLTAWASAHLCARWAERLPRSLARSSSSRAAIALLPIAVGTGVALSLVSPPAFFGGCHCIAHPHHIHLCFEHAAFSWSLAFASVVAAIGLVVAVRAVVSVLVDVNETARWSSRLRVTRAERDADIGIATELEAGAVTVGLLRARIIVGATLWSQLDETGRNAIAAHERAHVARRDPLTLLVLRLAACVMPGRASRMLIDGWRRAAEMACDRAAAQSLGDPYALASALVECGRIQSLEQRSSRRAAGLAAADSDDLELRVSSLLEEPISAATRSSTRGDLIGVMLAMAAVAFAVTVLGGASAHHAAETVLGWI